jgi:hypothetical protein
LGLSDSGILPIEYPVIQQIGNWRARDEPIQRQVIAVFAPLRPCVKLETEQFSSIVSSILV